MATWVKEEIDIEGAGSDAGLLLLRQHQQRCCDGELETASYKPACGYDRGLMKSGNRSLALLVHLV